ncbi:MAG: GerW family sporulation protein [Clostridia bacterium]|nr:GerW family sporulation protein [Clostridia bacterium]
MKEQSASGILGTTIDKIKNLVDTSTVIGEPMKVSEKITVIPISKVTYGFASGGSDFPSKTNAELFGGAGGAGITVTPVAFLVVNDDIVTIKTISTTDNPIEKVVSAVPEVVNTVTGLVNKFSKKDEPETDVIDDISSENE